MSEDVDCTRPLVKIENDTYYKSNMRGNVCEIVLASPGEVDPSNLEDHMQSLLQARTSHVKLAVKKLQGSLASLRSEITKALEREATDIVVGVPIFFSKESWREM